MIYEVDRLYKHKKMKDVAFYVMRKVYTPTHVEVTGMWMNVHYNELSGSDPWFVDAPRQTLKLKPEEEVLWEKYDVEANKKILRNG